LEEITTKDYLKRTEANVVDSDATEIFTQGKLSGGSIGRRLSLEHGLSNHNQRSTLLAGQATSPIGDRL
jgi:hypothetical protein